MAVTSKRAVVEGVPDDDDFLVEGGGHSSNEEEAIAKTVGTHTCYKGSQKTEQPGDLKRQDKVETCNRTQRTEGQKTKNFAAVLHVQHNA